MKNKSAFTLIELMIVVAIIGITSVFGISAWRNQAINGEFNASVSEIIGVFQEARATSLKSTVDTVSGDMDNYYFVEEISDGIIEISGDNTGVIASYDFTDEVTFDVTNFLVSYEVPYADFEAITGGDLDGNLVFTVTSLRSGSATETIIVHTLSGIAEIEN